MDAVTPHVLDLYHGDSASDFKAARAAGIQGIIHKASQGVAARLHDSKYAARRAQAKDAGMLWGAYHFLTFYNDPAAQAESFLEAAAPDDKTLIAVDYETLDLGRGLHPNLIARKPLQVLQGFLAAVEKRCGRKAVIYSGFLIKETLGEHPDAELGAHRLWLAHYAPHWSLGPLKAWSKPWLWQFTDKGKVCGIEGTPGGVDANHYDGPTEQLALEWAH